MIFFRPIHFIVCIVGTACLVHGLSISPSSAELGVFPSWERRSVTFIVKNHSKKPVSLLRVRSSCSCAITNFVPCTLDPAKGTMACRNILILHIRHTTEKTARSGQRKSASIAGDMPSMTWIGGMHTRVARRVCRMSTSGKSSRI